MATREAYKCVSKQMYTAIRRRDYDRNELHEMKEGAAN
jgi:hypothetical protein